MQDHSVIQDAGGRQFKTLRVSLLSHCNMACTYCTDGKVKPALHPIQDHGRLKDMILCLHEMLQFRAIRFTGGEPLLYPHLIALIDALHRELKDVPLRLTTNGYLLASKADALCAAGIQSVNVSLDAGNQDAFYRITKRRGWSKVLQGIEAAAASGMGVKINSVIMKGVNEQEIVPLLDYGRAHGVPVRYLELMKMGHLHTDYNVHFFSMREILHVLRSSGIDFTAMERIKHSTARYWQLPDGYCFGIIANETASFCHDCDRLRIDSHGNIYGCLSRNLPVNVYQFLNNDEKLKEALQKALLHKQAAFTGSRLPMIAIGG